MKVQDGEIHYRLLGEGPPLLMMRGYGSHLGWWDPAFLDGLKERFTLVLYDHRGTGSSRHLCGEYTIPLLADDAAALIENLAYDKVLVFGISMGGMVAQELALRHPGRIRVLVLAATSCGGDRTVPPAPAVMKLLLSRAGGDQAGGIGMDWLEAVFTPEFVRKCPDAVQAYLDRANQLPTPPAVMEMQAKAVSSFSSWDRLPSITCPTWILHGERDSIVPVPNAFVLQAGIPWGRAVILPGLGHDFPAQDPLYSSFIVKGVLLCDTWNL